ncbi:putative kinase/esterase [Stappia aggregata IAM 12614]|uniref:Putative kinase/esterase n=1 Tax=Roseibium aggregatum (strain ATCC 25650 / DSM 13394 / JCM 20685 / NBRC 16684 / NCIMB 2208 / IAM 12614 / B1) TaxID=384765 RepID=A0P262_ROSAI|nr:diguanylate cyclase [Roseibium aggregatum]EAV40918.1 putative kinase/esterase [Stappia aggregata IAM 12614] [Roseibium aggregatum IAM 12614]
MRYKPPIGHGSPPLQKAKGEAQAVEIRRLSKPFWVTVFISAVSLMVFVSFLSWMLDRHSIRSSEDIFTATLGDRADHLADITLEYGYWNDAVDNLVETLDLTWVREIFVDYMQEELHIEGIHLFDGNNQPKVHVVEGKIADVDLHSRYGPSMSVLIADARNTPKDEAPVPATGLVGTLEKLYLASAVLLTSYKEDNETSTDHVLVFARPVNALLLAEMAEKYHLPGLGLSGFPPAFWQAGFDVETVDRRHLGFFVWNPELAGFRILPLLAIGVLVVYLGMFFSARTFFHRAAETVRALAQAKHQAEKVKDLLANQVRSDPLTGLGNRRLLDEKLALLQDVKPLADGHALLYVDLDRFKDINDTYGHETGDVVLLYVAEALTGLANVDDTVVRLGGDEFVIVFGRARRERVLSTSRAIVEQLSRPVNLDGATYTFGASVGVAFSEKPSELLRKADVALYSAKRRGRAQVAVYSADLLDFRNVPIQSAAQPS